MPNKDAYGNPYRSKIAAIQEYSNFPAGRARAAAGRDRFADAFRFRQHTLVGPQCVSAEDGMAVPRHPRHPQDRSMLSDSGIDSIPTAEGAMLDQAVNRTATVTVGDVRNEGSDLTARVTVISKVGHKFPSGVGFRPRIPAIQRLDVNNKVLWSSGRTNGAGVIVDGKTSPSLSPASCGGTTTARRASSRRNASIQPHYQEITRRIRRRFIRNWFPRPRM